MNSFGSPDKLNLSPTGHFGLLWPSRVDLSTWCRDLAAQGEGVP